jgi:hypothetical protein
MRETKTLKQLETAWNELKEEILSRPLFLDNSEKAKAERKKKCENSVLEFARVYFPDYVPSEFAKFHKEWEQIRDIEKEPVPLTAFRGSGKPACFTPPGPVHEIAYGRRSICRFAAIASGVLRSKTPHPDTAGERGETRQVHGAHP